MDNDKTIRVAIVEDDRGVREGLAMIIGATPSYECTGKFFSAEEALRALNGATADVLLLDIHLPGMLGSDAVRLFREQYPSMNILMLTVYDGQDKVFESICNGACGYLLKKPPPAKLLEAIREACEGGAPMSPEVARRVVSLFREIRPPGRAEYHLTPHEMRLLKLLVQGHNYKTAAEELGVSFHTIHFHMRNVYDKLQVHSKSEAVSKALRDRII
jgi:DNA-binding NarL/FixJ family response regulator